MGRFPGGPPTPTIPTSDGLHIDQCFTGRKVAMRSLRGHVYAGTLRVESVKPPLVTIGFTHMLVGNKWELIREPDASGRIIEAGRWRGRPEYLVPLNTKKKPV